MGKNTGVRGRQPSIPHLARRALSVLTRRAALALCLLSLASCSDFSSASRSWWLRYHPEEDQAVYVEVMDGVTAEASSAEPLRKLVAGWRRFPAEGGLFTFDLDEELDWSDLPEAEAAERVRAILASLRAQVKVSEAGLFRVGAEGVGLYRAIEVKDLSVFLSDMNELFNTFLDVEWREKGVNVSWKHLELSDETKARWRARARAREPWLTRTGATFTLDVPMTEGEAAGMIRAVLEDAEDFPPGSWFMRALNGVRIADGSLTLSFSPRGQRFEGVSESASDSLDAEHAALLKTLEGDPGFVEFDRAKLLERVK